MRLFTRLSSDEVRNSLSCSPGSNIFKFFHRVGFNKGNRKSCLNCGRLCCETGLLPVTFNNEYKGSRLSRNAGNHVRGGAVLACMRLTRQAV
jgi:hypothetical protein